MLITKIEYTTSGNRPIIHIFGRDESGNRIYKTINTFEPYFYILESEKDLAVHPKIKRIERTSFKSFDDEPLLRVVTYVPSDVPKVRELFKKTYEADVLFHLRYSIDSTHKEDWGSGKLRILYFDIEVSDEGGFPDYHNATNPIISISCYDSFTNRYHTFIWGVNLDLDFSPVTLGNIEFKKAKVAVEDVEKLETNIYLFNNEYDMLQCFFKFIADNDFDILTGWNVIRFDMFYLLNRAKKLGINYNTISPLKKVIIDEKYEQVKIYGRGVIDLLTTYKKLSRGELESYSLDSIAKRELGLAKLEIEKISGSLANRIHYLWLNNPEKLIKYNLRDVYLTVLIDKKVQLIDYLNEVRKIVGCNWEDLMPSRIVDTLLLKKAKQLRIALPTKSYKKTLRSYEGAVVFNPTPGIHEWVFVSDFKSLYPSIIRTFNISPDTLNKKGINLPNNKSFASHQSYLGIIPQLFDELFKLRKYYKTLRNRQDPESVEYKIYDNKQFAVKSIINSIYGVLALPSFRLYELDCASSITFMGRTLIKTVKDFLENYQGIKVIYGDTDSVFFKLSSKTKEEAVEEGIRLTEMTNKHLRSIIRDKFNIPDEFIFIHLEPQKLYRRIIFTKAKKRYAGLLIWKEGKDVNELDVVGFEAKRSDIARIAKEMQKNIFKLILSGKPKAEVSKYIRDTISKILSGKVNYEDIAIPKTIRKKFSSYKANVPWIRAVNYSNKYLGFNFKPGDKVRLIFIKDIKDPKYPKTDVIAVTENYVLPDGFVIDWRRMIEHNIQNKIATIFESLGWGSPDRFLLSSNQKTFYDWGVAC